jgi:hypothetical protein
VGVRPDRVSTATIFGATRSACARQRWWTCWHERCRASVNEHLEKDGPIVFKHACKLGLEGILAKAKDSGYRSGRSPDWIKSKSKNPDAPAVRREAEEDWGR